MTKIKTLSELASEDENRFLEDERKQESKAFKIARERMKLKGEINELKMKLSELREENKKLKKELGDIKSKKAQLTKDNMRLESIINTLCF